jgi:hypothetical protein
MEPQERASREKSERSIARIGAAPRERHCQNRREYNDTLIRYEGNIPKLKESKKILVCDFMVAYSNQL